MIAFSLIIVPIALLLSLFFFHWNFFQCVNRCLGLFYCFSLTCPTPSMGCKGLWMGGVDTAGHVAGSVQRKVGWEGGMLGCWTMLFMFLFFYHSQRQLCSATYTHTDDDDDDNYDTVIITNQWYNNLDETYWSQRTCNWWYLRVINH